MVVRQAKWKKVPMGELTAVKSGMFQVYVDYYWVVTKEGELLFYKFGNDTRQFGSPQCNANREITEKVAKHIVDIEYDIIQLKAVFVPINPSDYV